MDNRTFHFISPAPLRSLPRGSSVLLACVLAVLLPGCRERDSDPRLVDVAVKLETTSERIRELSLALEGMNARLVSLEESVQSLMRPAVRGEGSIPPSTGASPPGSAQVERLSEQVAVLTEELATTKEGLASAWGAVEKIGERLPKPDGGKVEERLLKLAGRPDKFIEMLDALVSNVSPTIEDVTTRSSFEAEISRLRDRVASPPSPQELFAEFRARHVEKLNAVTNEKDRQAVEGAIAELDNASEEALQKRIDRYGRERTMEELGRIVKQNSLREEDVLPVLSKYIKGD